MKNRNLTIVVSAVLTAIILLAAVYLLFGMNKKPARTMSLDSPDGIYTAYVVENPSLDPPNQSLFLSKTGSDEFRLVEDLPEDIELVKQIFWSPDSRKVVFSTNWYLIITDVGSFSSRKISLNPDWWRWNKNRKTFSSSARAVEMKELHFIGSDTLLYRTDQMEQTEKVCL
jgi:hypothetical protein